MPASPPRELRSRPASCLLILAACLSLAACGAPRTTPQAPTPTAETARQLLKPARAAQKKTATQRAEPAAKRGGAPARKVEYRLSGALKPANVIYVTYGRDRGEATQSRVRLPWRLKFTAREGEFLYVSGQFPDRATPIRCEIWVDGKAVHRASSGNSSPIASCSGTVSK